MTVRQAASGADTPLLRLSGITKRFPAVVANERVSFELGRGEIHGLLGENGAGKTTLMNIMYGLLEPDEGRIEVDGNPVTIRSPRDALALGIGMVHQHFMLVPDMTVAENVALSLTSAKLEFTHLDRVGARLSELSQQFGLAVDPGAVIGDLSVGVRQRVEILKLLYRGAEILILDEPTATLTPPEWRQLANILLSLTAEGKGIIFITHKLDELFGVAQRCTVLRAGRVVGTAEVARTSKEALARMMVGRDVELRVNRTALAPGQVVLDVEGLTVLESGRTLLDNVTFEVREREILGIAGVEGNGQTELVEALVGIRRPTAGTLRMNGRLLDRVDPNRLAAAGGAVIPEDRHRDAIALAMSVRENVVMKDVGARPFSRLGVLNIRAATERAAALVAQYDIRVPSLESPIGKLSGGNQQKAVLAREIHRRPRLLVAAQPTRGLDVGAAAFVYEKLIEHRAAGGAVLLISVELDEILSLADRIGVMFRGRLVRILDASNANLELLGPLMARGEAAAT
jgi:ABC-type uncharacterized transport system ATPase subunit